MRPLPQWAQRLGAAGWYFVGAAAAVAIVVVSIAATKDLVVPLVLAAFLAAVFTPLVDRLSDGLRMSRGIAAALVVAGILGIFAASGAVIVASLTSQTAELVDELDEAQEDLQEWFDDLDLDPELVEQAREQIRSSSSTAGSGVGSQFLGIIGSAFSVVTGSILGVIFLYYLLKDGRMIVNWCLEVAGVSESRVHRELAADSVRTIQAYFKGRTVLAAVQAVLIAASTALLGVPLAFAIGVVNFIGAYVPYLGGFVGGAFAVVLALSSGGFWLAMVVLVIVVSISVLLENALEPRLLGSALSIHPLAVLVATVLGGLLAGLVGLTLGAPLAAIGKQGYERLRDEGWFDDPDGPDDGSSDRPVDHDRSTDEPDV